MMSRLSTTGRRHGAAGVALALLLAACGTNPSSPSAPGSVTPSEPADSGSAGATATPAASVEESAAPSAPGGLQAGAILRVEADRLRMRADPTTSAATVLTLPVGASVGYVSGPVEADGLAWYEVRIGSSVGWVSAGEAKDWLAVLEPLP
jgi:hypothetical protein